MELINPSPTQMLDTLRMQMAPEFKLSRHSSFHINKIRDEIMDKVSTWDKQMTPMFSYIEEWSESYRVQPRKRSQNKTKGLSSAKSGETHRATETLATAWFRMLTADDHFYQAVKRGLSPDGREYTEADLYKVEAVLKRQLQVLKFKPELLTGLNSCALFGTVIFEEPWITKKTLDGLNYFEGTGFKTRPLIQTGFDTSCMDVDESDFIFTVDYPTVWRLLKWMKDDPNSWDTETAEQKIRDAWANYTPNSYETNTNVLSRIIARKQRAGYNLEDTNIREFINYHGKLETNNPVIEDYWESMGYQEEPSDYDFTAGILEANLVKFHVTQFGSWHTRFKCAHYKKFEVEPIAYGVGKLAGKMQRMLDVTDSRSNDILMFALYNMFKLGRFSGLKPKDLIIKPQHVLEMEDISQLEALKPDINAIVQGLAMRAQWIEDLRSTTGASANLQAQVTKATATESAITQNESIRSVSVHAEIIAETLLREHLEQMHINNLYFLDHHIWVDLAGDYAPMMVNRNNLPANIGFEIKVTTDKDFRPERIQKILEALNSVMNLGNFVPNSINAIGPLFYEFFRSLGMDPRLLEKPMNVKDQMMYNLLRQGKMGGGGNPGEQAAMAEAFGDPTGGGSNISTPAGPVPTSPLASSVTQGLAA